MKLPEKLTHLLKPKRGGAPKLVTPQGAYHPAITKAKGKPTNLGGILIQSAVGTGKYKKDQVIIRGYLMNGTWFPFDKKAINRKLRKLRPQEEAKLADNLSRINALRKERNEILKEAFSKGHTIPMTEIKELIAKSGSHGFPK